MTSRSRILVLISILALACSSRVAFAGRGGFRGGGGFGGGGNRGGGFAGGGFAGGGNRGGGGFAGGGAEGFRGGYGTPSFNRTPSFSMPQSYGGYGGARATGAMNPYAAGGTSFRSRESASGPLGGQSQAGSRSGSFTTQGGSTVRYGAAGVGGVGPGGTAAGRGVGGVQVTTPGGRTATNVGRAGGAVGPGGRAVGGRSNIGVASGPGGVAVAGSRGGFAAGPGGVVAAGSRGGVVAGPGGVVAGRGYGVAGASRWHNPAYTAYHSGWVHGYWNGHYGGWGWGGYGTGLAAWGLGSALYSGWGYAPYDNPYYDAPTAVVPQPVYDYSQPISTTDAPPDAAVTDPAMTAFDQAREAFKTGDYDQALASTDQALKAMPNDSTIHEFRAQVLIALGRYDEAAAALYGVLSVGPGWNWTTLIGLYPDVAVYTAQLDALVQSIRSNPDSAPPRFVLAYLYLTEGQNDAAAQQLKAVTQLQPDDRVSAQLLQSMTKPQADGAAADATPEPTAAPPQTPAEPVKGGTLEGTWSASPDKDSAIALSIAAGGDFTWKVTTKGQSHPLSGQSTYGSGVLTLVQAEGGPPMVGRVTWQDADHFVFQALGGGPGDPGLSFRRSS
jgi:tetratricopeptide (TPR) repeat protein